MTITILLNQSPLTLSCTIRKRLIPLWTCSMMKCSEVSARQQSVFSLSVAWRLAQISAEGMVAVIAFPTVRKVLEQVIKLGRVQASQAQKLRWSVAEG